MRIIHLCWGLETTNGAANIARLLVGEQRAAGHDVALKSAYSRAEIAACDELWCHCGWYWRIWRAVSLARRLGKRIFWMPEGCYDPIRLAYHGWKKRLVGFFERRALRRCDALVATCDAEAEWIRQYVGPNCPTVKIDTLRRFFTAFSRGDRPQFRGDRPLKVLYLGRRHPLKGVEFLESAVREVNARMKKEGGATAVELRLVSGATGEALEETWSWCDVLCLPTLSDNLGLVVAEALAHGRFVITTDGAPAWISYFDENKEQGVCLCGYRDGSSAQRVELLVSALTKIIGKNPSDFAPARVLPFVGNDRHGAVEGR